MTMDWGNWLYGLIAGLVSAGANAITTGTLLAMTDPDHVFSSKFWVPILGMFVLSAVKDAGLYLAQHPLPAIVKTTVETTKKKSPTSTVVTTIETTEAVSADLDTKKKSELDRAGL